MSDLRIGVAGVGVMGVIHAENAAKHVPGVRLVAIAELMEERAQAVASELGVERVYATPAEMIESGAIDAIVVCTPGDTHADAIEAAAERSVHVLTEKPLDRDLARADSALAAANRAGIKLMLAFNRRYDPSVLATYNALQSGEMGRLLTVHIVARDPVRESGVKPPGDIFLDTTIHDLDTACWMAGAEPVLVSASGGCIGGLDDPDYAVTTITLGNGVVATIDNNRVSAHGYDQRVEVCGTSGMAATDNGRPDLAEVSGPGGALRAPPLPFFTERYAVSYVAELRAFVDCVRNDTPVPVTGEDGRRALVLALAAHRSYLEDRPVRVNEIG